MKELVRENKRPDFRLLQSFVVRTLVGAMFAYYLVYLANEPFEHQLAYIAVCVLLSLLMDYLTARSKGALEVKLVEGKLALLGVTIEIAQIEQVLYCQSKRFEHQLRFRFKDRTYQDFELSEPSLIADLQLYYFLLDNQLPVKMLDNAERLN
ncbi:hypothetical protein AYI74_13290 [Shewanella algae]|uniref:hypothetical protein n=2 Tax=Shewanella algae TaxID=38313 RepID=UPI000D14E865|nr:hypothetical protein [Shewanella algae]PST67974.1 hypothetical protein AYI77_06530 [Shewanella algae]TWU67752.1 hypothetical protein AYI74_13290 [Shewanella algae]BCV59390.1 hypothetical protein TUM17384_33350 [Shewanella algae]